jgi:drug/metabolite transporter (DMT)-like permease
MNRPGWPAEARGYLCLFLSVVLNAVGIHAWKFALRDSTPLTVNVLSGIMASGLFLGVGLLWRRLGWRAGRLGDVSPAALAGCLRRQGLWLLLPPAAAALGGWFLNICIKTHGPETASFLMNLTLVFLVGAGLWRGERLSRAELGTVAILIAGAFVFTYQGGRFEWAALVLMIGSCLATATKQLAVKRVSESKSLPLVMTAVLLLSAAWSAAAMALAGGWRTPDLRTLGFLALGAVACNTLGMSLLYAAYHAIGVSRGAPLDAMRPLAVLAIGLFLGAPAPGPIRLLGAAMILGGSVLLTWLNGRRKARAADSVDLLRTTGTASSSSQKEGGGNP